MTKQTLRCLILTLLVVPVSALADNEASKPCLDKAHDFLQTDAEKFIYQQSPANFDFFINCEEEEFPYSIQIALHESVHFIDLNIKSTVEEVMKSGKSINDLENDFNYLTLNLKRLPMPRLNLPKPFDLIDEKFQKRHSEELKDEMNYWPSTYREYVLDRSASVSESFERGVLLEMNAYNHSARTEHSLRSKKMIPTLFAAGDRLGALFMISIAKMYLTELKVNYPEEWNRAFGSGELKALLKSQLNDFVSMMTETGFCSEKDPDPQWPEKSVKLYREISSSDALAEFVGADIVDRLNSSVACY